MDISTPKEIQEYKDCLYYSELGLALKVKKLFNFMILLFLMKALKQFLLCS